MKTLLTRNARLILGSLAVVALLVWFSPVEALSLKDATGGIVPGSVPGSSLSNDDSPVGAVTTVAQLMQRFADGAAALAGAVAILFVAINAARMAFSLGDTEALSKAKKGLIWSAAGLLLIIFAYIVTKSVIALTYSGADGSSVIGTGMIQAPGNPTFAPVAGGSNPNGLCKDVGPLPSPCIDTLDTLDTDPLDLGLSTRTITVGGITREFDVYAPAPALDESQAVPVLMVFHGAGGSSSGIAQTTNLSALAESQGFVVVYPESLTTGGEKRWVINGLQDVLFVEALMSEVYTALEGRVTSFYVAGMSNGSVFAQAAACQISEIVGLASAAGSLGAARLEQCNRSAPLDMISFYGTLDPINQQDRFEAALDYLVTEVNSCDPTLQTISLPNVDPDDNTTVERLTLEQSCEADMAYYRVNDGGHFWPGGNYTQARQDQELGHVTRDINASELVADFFNLAPQAASTEPPIDQALLVCSQAAAAAMAGICSDLGISPCTILGLETELEDYELYSMTSCDEPDNIYNRCTFRGLQELYQSECIL